MRKLGYLSDDRPIPRKKRRIVTQPEAYFSLKKENNDKDPAELQKRIQELERVHETLLKLSSGRGKK